ncbi:hypothetical protein [Kordiimonas sp.]|uniref:hypothetical protein n=1 Tax=Kordiimonas sp. TaxID=1970157 RepID=UPI003B51E885
MNKTHDGVIEDACLVSFADAPEHHKNLRLLCGCVVEDRLRRFRSGDAFRSSPVLEVDGYNVRTANSLYQVEGPLDHIELPWSHLEAVLRLMHPREIKGFVDEGFTEILIHAETQKE